MKRETVLNTDLFDDYTYDKIYQSSKKLQSITEQQDYPYFRALQQDMWSSLYKVNPQIEAEVAPELVGNKSLLEKVMADEAYAESRPKTTLDTLCSAISSLLFTEKLSNWLEDMKQQPPVKEAYEQLQNAAEEEEQAAKEQLASAIQQQAEAGMMDFTSIPQDSKPIEKGVQALLAGTGHKESKVPLRHQLELAELLMQHPKLSRIANEMGRFQILSGGFKKVRVEEAPGVADITLGSELEQVLSAELVGIRHKQLKPAFHKKFVEKNLLMFKHEGEAEAGLGPMVICVDESGSMSHRQEEAKAFCLSLLLKAKKQKRDVAIIRFDDQTLTHTYKRGEISASELVQFTTSFMGGGTNFERPLHEAVQQIQTSRFQKADIVFITDGEADVSEAFLIKYYELKKERGFHTYGILIGVQNTASLDRFCDEVTSIQNLKDTGAIQVLKKIN